MKRPSFCLLVFLTLLLAACAMPATPTVDFASLKSMSTYTDTTIGYALDYPPGWLLTEQPYGITLSSSASGCVAGNCDVKPDESKLELIPELPGGFNTLNQLVAQLKRGGEGGVPQITREEGWELAGGVPAVRMDRKLPGGTIATLSAVINGRGVTLFGYGDLAPFDEIAHTLRPVVSATAVVEASIAVQLAGREWLLRTLNGADLLPGAQITINFTAKTFSGFAGCNHYSGDYTLDGTVLHIGMMQNTLMACAAPGVMDQEKAYLDALSSATALRLIGDRLEIANAGGALIFGGQAPPQPEDSAATPAPPPPAAQPVTPAPSEPPSEPPAAPQRMDGSRFPAREGFSFAPPDGWYSLNRFETPDGGRQYTFATAPHEVRGVAGELQLLVLVAPGVTAETWPPAGRSTDVIDGDILQQSDRVIDGRPAMQLEYDMNRNPRPAELTAGARLAIQDGDTLVLFWAFAPTWGDFAPYQAQVNALFDSVRFDTSPQASAQAAGLR